MIRIGKFYGWRCILIPLINKRETGINLRRIMDAKGITVKDVQQYLELGSVQSIYHWLNGNSLPTIDNLYALSELFQMPVDEMICGNRTPVIKRSIKTQTDQDRRLYSYFEKITEKKIA